MAKKDDEKQAQSSETRRASEREELREVEWGSDELAAARKSGNASRMPSGVKIRSPYGTTPIDQGTMRMLEGDDNAGGPAMGRGAGAITDNDGGGAGGDANTGSTAGGRTTRGAND